MSGGLLLMWFCSVLFGFEAHFSVVLHWINCQGSVSTVTDVNIINKKNEWMTVWMCEWMNEWMMEMKTV